jgi:hypothetical protein
VQLVDTRAWTTRSLGARATVAFAASGLLFAVDPALGSARALVAYDASGHERFRLPLAANSWPMAAFGAYLYVATQNTGTATDDVDVVDVRTGAVAGHARTPYVWLLGEAPGREPPLPQ